MCRLLPAKITNLLNFLRRRPSQRKGEVQGTQRGIGRNLRGTGRLLRPDKVRHAAVQPVLCSLVLLLLTHSGCQLHVCLSHTHNGHISLLFATSSSSSSSSLLMSFIAIVAAGLKLIKTTTVVYRQPSFRDMSTVLRSRQRWVLPSQHAHKHFMGPKWPIHAWA